MLLGLEDGILQKERKINDKVVLVFARIVGSTILIFNSKFINKKLYLLYKFLKQKLIYKMKVAFIVGINGQDGTYLCNYLLSKNYKVFGVHNPFSKNKFNFILNPLIKQKKLILYLVIY